MPVEFSRQSPCARISKRERENIPIEVEVRSLDDIRDVFAAGGCDRIMLDNFTPEMTREAVKLIDGRIEIESSGGITLKICVNTLSVESILFRSEL